MKRTSELGLRDGSKLLVFAGLAILVAGVLPNSEHFARADDNIAEAIAGSPFGVGRITIPLKPEDDLVQQLCSFALVESKGRVFYSVFSAGPVQRLLDEVLKVENSSNAKAINAYFLFTGDEPLTIKVYTSQASVVRLTPQAARPLMRLRLQQAWWREFSAQQRMQAEAGDYPPLVETYLTSMLSARFGLPTPLLSLIKEDKQNEIFAAMQLLGGSEYEHLVQMRDMFQAPPDSDATAQALPAPIRWAPPAAISIDDNVNIEPIAQRVPRECFYVRFGSWDNQLWLSYLTREYGGDLGRMISLRGLDTQSGNRFEQQLVLFQNTFADLFAGQVVKDLAFIGRDFYFREGASIGVIIEAKNDFLKPQLDKERKRVQQEYAAQGAAFQDFDVDGHPVSFLSTPDNRIRSFYATDGKFHIVTNSRQLVDRFFQVPVDKSALALTGEFQNIRQQMPLDREDTIFAYFSPDFFHALLEPQYQIETRRRVRAAVKIKMLQLAILAAKNETGQELTVDELIAGGYLPPRYTLRFDGLPLLENGEWRDTLRGGQRTFLPVVDVPVTAATRGEVEFFNARAAYVSQKIPRMDPLAVGMRRFALNESGLERLVVEAKMSPTEPDKYGWLMSMLGPPMQYHVQSMKNEVVSVRASLDGGLIFPDVPPHQWFIGIQDEIPQVTKIKRAGFFELLDIAKNTPGYFGAWPKPELIDRFPTLLSRDVDRDGFSRSLIGLWRMQEGDFSVLSFDKQRLADIRPQLDVVRTTVPVQIQFDISDLSQSNLKTWISTLTYQRALQASQGNSRLLHTLSQQLGVPVKEACAVAESLLDAKLTCAMVGTYNATVTPSGLHYWTSDKWPPENQTNVPADYEAPFLKWFRGCSGSLLVDNGQLNARIFLDMQRDEKQAKVSLPSFSIFGGK